MQYRSLVVTALALALAFVLSLLPTAAAAASQPLEPLNHHLDRAATLLRSGDLAGSRAEWQAFEAGWPAVADDVQAHSLPAYRAIIAAMANVRAAYAAPTDDPAQVASAIQRLDATDDRYLAGSFSSAGASAGAVTPTAEASHNDRALALARGHDAAGATAELALFLRGWPDIETTVQARNATAYTEIENDAASARADLAAAPPDFAGAIAALTRIHAAMAPILDEGAAYGPLDAAFILFREGLEAILVITALLAYLRKSGNGKQSRWIWAGGAAGIVASIAVAVLVQQVFARAVAGVGRELFEGVTALLAGAMLVTMSWWLHSKASIGAWNRYIAQQSGQALANGRLFSLSLLAFIAVFREGAESLLFFVGIAPTISVSSLLLGLALGAAALLAIGIAIIGVGVRIPLRPFFLAASLLVYYLAFKFVGAGLHALQVAAILPATPSPHLPSLDWLGLFPTWQTTVPQLVLLLAAVAILVWPHRHSRRGVHV